MAIAKYFVDSKKLELLINKKKIHFSEKKKELLKH